MAHELAIEPESAPTYDPRAAWREKQRKGATEHLAEARDKLQIKITKYNVKQQKAGNRAREYPVLVDNSTAATSPLVPRLDPKYVEYLIKKAEAQLPRNQRMQFRHLSHVELGYRKKFKQMGIGTGRGMASTEQQYRERGLRLNNRWLQAKTIYPTGDQFPPWCSIIMERRERSPLWKTWSADSKLEPDAARPRYTIANDNLAIFKYLRNTASQHGNRHYIYLKF